MELRGAGAWLPRQAVSWGNVYRMKGKTVNPRCPQLFLTLNHASSFQTKKKELVMFVANIFYDRTPTIFFLL
jgi:hypothetical protein